jgi:hypothetical protein
MHAIINHLFMMPLSIRYILIFSLLISGCSPAGLYYWGDYEESLYQRYIEHDSEKAEDYVRETLEDAVSENRVPPGLYADYGFMFYQRGNKNAAIEYFEKEKKLFPESSALMSTLIERVIDQNFRKRFEPQGEPE